MRNHGFLLTETGWKLSPAYDINPEPTGSGLHLNISEDENTLDLDLALSVSEFFRLDEGQARAIIDQVKEAVSNWRTVARDTGISLGEQKAMARAFHVAEE